MIYTLRDILWSGAGTLLLTGFGLFFTFKTKFIQLHPVKTLKMTLCRLSGGSFAAAATALGGTIGAGSVVGVSVGIAAGGAGSIFWMWVSGFFGMALRYAETKAAMSDRERVDGVFRGGAMVCLAKLGKRKAAVMFCVTAVLVSLGTGALTQSAAVSEMLLPLGVSEITTGIVMAAVFSAVIFCGRNAVLKVNAFLVPLCCAAYLACLFYIIVRSASNLPAVLADIFGGAFGFDSAIGGFAAYGLTRAVREGFSRGVFSNESGMGSAPLAYCCVEDATSEQQARFGIVEIFADTFVISTLTALCLLCGGFDGTHDMFARFFGSGGGWLIAVLLFVFALASMLCWSFYADVCVNWLTQSKGAKLVYRLMAAAAVFAGAVMPESTVWAVADIFNILMIFPNLYMLSLKARTVYAGFETGKGHLRTLRKHA